MFLPFYQYFLDVLKGSQTDLVECYVNYGVGAKYIW